MIVREKGLLSVDEAHIEAGAWKKILMDCVTPTPLTRFMSPRTTSGVLQQLCHESDSCIAR